MSSRLPVVLALLVAGLCASAGSAHAAGCTASYTSLTHRVMIQSPGLSKLALARRAVRFTLSERATVTLRLERRARGRWVRMRGRLTQAGVEGRNRVVLRGRLARRALAAGRYRLVARATDPAGNRSAPRRAAFRIIAR